MARNKIKEAEYKAEGLRRIAERQQKRKDKWSYKVNTYGRGTKKCPDCGNHMSWCSSCEVWSQTCCQDYGTCQCS